MTGKSSRSAGFSSPERLSLRNHSAQKASVRKFERSWTRRRKRRTMPKIRRHDLDGCDDDIAKLYLKTAANQIKRMAAAIRSKSMPGVQQFAHKLSGSSGFLELKEMAILL